MEPLNLEQAADLIAAATIEQTADHGHAIVHVGITEAGHRFVLVNDCDGASVVSYQV